MVQTNELRIGNWLQYKNNPECAKYFKVEGLWKKTIAEIDYKEQVISGLSELVYEAIPLTPEILEKCDLETDHLRNKIKKDETWFHGTPLNFKIARLPEMEFYIYSSRGNTIAVRYLHQLQNLYFALTGEELTCTL